jgi:DNA-binding transcriptional MerR regulator
MVQETTLRIGELATRSGLTPDALRYYERFGLMPRARRTAGGYRVYPVDATERIQFIKQAQANGLTLTEIRELLGFRDRGGRNRCHQVEQLLTRKIADLDAKLVQLQEFKRTLQAYRRECEEAQRQMTDECPVVEHLGRRR